MHENDEMYLSAELLPAKISLAHTSHWDKLHWLERGADNAKLWAWSP